jgi:hypothetical protein
MRTEPLERDPIDSAQYEYAHAATPWACHWIAPQTYDPDGAAVFAYRLNVDHAGDVRLHVSADQRYILFLDGKRIGRGPERGDLRHWMYDSYDLSLSGNHTLVAITWWISPTSPTPPAEAQLTARPAFMLNVQGDAAERFCTGVAPWSVRRIDGVQFVSAHTTHGYFAIDPRVQIDGFAYPWGIESGAGEGWSEPRKLRKPTLAALVREAGMNWQIRPAMLPAMHETRVKHARVRHAQSLGNADASTVPVRRSDHDSNIASTLQKLFDGDSVTVPAGSRWRAIVDFEDYHCVFTHLSSTGGRDASVCVGFAESLYVPDENGKAKGFLKRYSDIEGLLLVGFADTFTTDGAPDRVFDSLWWSAGRYVEVVIETQSEPLTLNALAFDATGYPYRFDGSFESSDARLATVVPLGLRTLRACSHETSMDCPYYEQLNYAGDTRLQSLVAMTWSRDDRLVRKSIDLFDWSRTGDSWASSRYPTRTTQTIPTFCMWWVAMVYDYARYRGDRAFVAAKMPGVRAILERWRQQIDPDGLVRTPAGWNFVDWVKQWKGGSPTNRLPDRPCGVIHWQLIYTLSLAAELETMMNEPLLAQRHTQTASALAAVAERVYFDERRGLLADDTDHAHFSEHAQVLALISTKLSSNLRDRVAAGIIDRQEDLAHTSIYFSHYTFAALRSIDRVDKIIDRMSLWFEHEKMGLYTLLESPEPSRSDCHAWGAHPLYHYFDSFLGIRPASFGFQSVDITPDLGPLTHARGTMIHPQGEIRVDLRRTGDASTGGQLTGTIDLPGTVTGVFRHDTRLIRLASGRNTV